MGPMGQIRARPPIPSSATFGAGRRARPGAGGLRRRLHSAAAPRLLSPMPGCPALPSIRPLAAGGRHSAHSTAARAARPPLAAGGSRLLRAASVTRRTIRPTHRRSGAQGTAKPPATPRATAAIPAPSYQPPSRHRFPAGAARPKPHRPHTPRAAKGASAPPRPPPTPVPRREPPDTPGAPLHGACQMRHLPAPQTPPIQNPLPLLLRKATFGGIVRSGAF